MRKITFISVVVSLLLSGCVNPPKPLNLPNGYVLPPMPDSTENNETIGGIDSNDNGVRDDVEIWIYTEHENKDMHQVMMQHARQIQRAFLNVKSKKDVHIAFDEMDKSIQCEIDMFGSHTRLYEKVLSKIKNTKARVGKDLEISRLAGGEVFSSPKYKGSPCEK